MFVCVFVYVHVVGWFGRLVCRLEQSTFIVEKEPLRIAISLQIKDGYLACTLGSEVLHVSIEEEHVDDCEMSKCMMLRCALHVHLLD